MGCFFGGKNRKPLEQETLRPVKSYSSLYDNEPTLLPDPHAVEIPKNSHEKQPAANSRTKEFFRGSSLVKNRPRVLSAPSRVFGSELDLQSTFIDGSEVGDRLPVSTATNPSAAGGFGLCTWKDNTEAASLVGRAVPLPVPQEARHPLPLPLSRGDFAHKISGGTPVLQNSSSASNSRHSNVLKPCQLSSFGSEPQPLPLPSQVVSTSSLRLFLREEILAGCQNFSPSYWLRDTRVGPVYRCSVKNPGSNEKMEVAVTRISRSNIEGEGENLSSFETHAQVQSPFVSKLLGLCMPKAIGRRRENVEWLLVSEHVESEGLEILLRKQDQSSLDWSARVKIALGTAKALDYLHQEKFRLQQCFDGDFDLCNIQVEKNFNPKLSDYGFQWLLKHDVSEILFLEDLGERKLL
ncbi:hypothetical protein O6H91_19G017800 [Diphasiastrum complanatum]|uniref:Uncharacterized protein n=1 Tax=Diphasiastrum complanatum TaxID=34168 RepID=A0ACC2ATC8_DIPCM|nr:hypothetical protein O6H91_19G017800 [Diphasiastrum complanatum]